MSVTQIADVIVPQEFTTYQIENSVVTTALFQSGVLVKNGVIADQLQAGAQSFNVPFWKDLGEAEADITSDDPAVLSTPQKYSAGKQVVRKSFLHQSWSDMSLASELSGDDPLKALQGRVLAYWDRQWERRLIASLLGVMASNVANNAADMVNDISGASGTAADFSAEAVIDAAATLGDHLDDVKAIAMHSDVYTEALKGDLIEFIPQSQGLPIRTFRGLGVIIDDNLTPATGVYTTILMGNGAVGFGVSEPRIGYGSEIFRVPDAGKGGGQTVLHSRMNVGIHPVGFAWSDGSGGAAIAGDSPTLAELAAAAHWSRVATSRKSIPLAFLVSK
ncbi:MAG: major capsid protein [Edaphobacter sp.]